MSVFAAYVWANTQFYLTMLLRLFIACVLGGLIGYERENVHRPAGFRTHILVCVGAALVMVTSEYIFRRYSGFTNADPARLGAQVISGIGFLGAGTIIRQGATVKGLTTAASLWAVSCVGIAVGIGFYEGAIAATVLIYLTLITLKKLEDFFSTKNQHTYIYVNTEDVPGQIGAIGCVFGKYDIPIKNIEFINTESETHVIIKFLLKFPDIKLKESVMEELHSIKGVKRVFEEL